MNTCFHSARRAFALTVLLAAAGPCLASAAGSHSDRASDLLATRGAIALSSIGPYVEVGTYRIQVQVKLGSPSQTLPDGTWLYRGFTVQDSNATGTIVVRFVDGRVSDLSLVGPAQEIALLRSAHPAATLVARK